jgi:Zn-dependent metalloprotease
MQSERMMFVCSEMWCIDTSQYKMNPLKSTTLRARDAPRQEKDPNESQEEKIFATRQLHEGEIHWFDTTTDLRRLKQIEAQKHHNAVIVKGAKTACMGVRGCSALYI